MANVTVAEIQGVVEDELGQPISSAELKLRPANIKQSPPMVNATANSNGQFTFPGLKPGWYWLRASSPGFSPTEAHIHVSPLRFLLFSRNHYLLVPLTVGVGNCAQVRQSPSKKPHLR